MINTSKIKNDGASSKEFSWSEFDGLQDIELTLSESGREKTLQRVGKLLSGLTDEYLVVADDVDDDVKYYVSVSKDTPEGKVEYVVVEDTLTEAIEKEKKSKEKLEAVRAIPMCDEKYIAKQIEQTGKDAEDIVGEYLDNLSTYLLNEQGEKTPKSNKEN